MEGLIDRNFPTYLMWAKHDYQTMFSCHRAMPDDRHLTKMLAVHGSHTYLALFGDDVNAAQFQILGA